MAYTFKYRLALRPQARIDGSGRVIHDIWAIYSSDGETWLPMQGYHAQIPLPAAELAVVMAMPHAPGAERQAKNTAYKNLLRQHVADTVEIATLDWDVPGMAAFMELNDAAVAVAVEADNYITQVLNQDYPLDFVL